MVIGLKHVPVVRFGYARKTTMNTLNDTGRHWHWGHIPGRVQGHTSGMGLLPGPARSCATLSATELFRHT